MSVSIARPAAALVVLLLAGCSATAKAPPAPPPAPVVEVAPVLFQPVPQWQDFTGRLEAVQTVELKPRVSGYVVSANFPEGGQVRAGQLLFQIDPRPFQAEVDHAAAELQSARASAALANSDADRAARLFDQQAIARGEYERLQSAAQVATAGVRAAEAALKAAQLNLSFTRVTSPIDGRVSKALITKGNLVTTSSLLTSVVSDRPIYASFNADEQTYLRFASAQRGSRSVVYMGLMTESGFPHRGRLQFLDNALDSGSGTINARAVFDNGDGRLTPGLFARIRLVSDAAETAAIIPERSLGSDLGKRFVLVLDARNRVQYRSVALGPAVGDARVVRAGLRAGDEVVTAGLNKVQPGDAVRPRRVAFSLGDTQGRALSPTG